MGRTKPISLHVYIYIYIYTHQMCSMFLSDIPPYHQHTQHLNPWTLPSWFCKLLYMNQIHSNWSRLQNCNSALGSSLLSNFTTVNCGHPAIQPTNAMSYSLDKAGKLAHSMSDSRVSHQWLWKLCLLACNITEIYQCFWMSLLPLTNVPNEPNEGCRFLWETSKYLSDHTA
jgi:hypothetical protein